MSVIKGGDKAIFVSLPWAWVVAFGPCGSQSTVDLRRMKSGFSAVVDQSAYIHATHWCYLPANPGGFLRSSILQSLERPCSAQS